MAGDGKNVCCLEERGLPASKAMCMQLVGSLRKSLRLTCGSVVQLSVFSVSAIKHAFMNMIDKRS